MLVRRITLFLGAFLATLLAVTATPALGAEPMPTPEATAHAESPPAEPEEPDDPGNAETTAAAAGSDTDGEAVSERSRRPHDLRVATFNIKNVLFARRPTADWRKRRQVIIRQILDHHIGIVGLQEANPGHYTGVDYPDGVNQYMDLKNGLNKATDRLHYKMTSSAAYNCVNERTQRRCVKKNRGASRSTRIMYNARRFTLLDSGSVLYKKQIREDRYLVWAVFRSKVNGRKFLFTTTHLTSGSTKVRTAQWKQLIKKVQKLQGRMPVIITGDFNVQKYHPIARTMLPAMSRAGFPDVLNQRYASNPVNNRPRAARTTNAWINSYNHGRRDVRKFSFHQERRKVGNGIDWIFASSRLDVQQYKVVVDYDPRTLKVSGVLPSDHNMVMAEFRLR